MFCTSCGKQIADDARFCNHCGTPTGAASASAPAPAQPSAAPAPTAAQPPTASSGASPAQSAIAPSGTVGGSAALLDQYVQRLAAKLGQQPRYIPELGAYLMVTERFSAALANLHQFFFITAYDAAGFAEMQAYTQSCSAWALDNYTGVLRGMQKGVVTYAVLLQHPMDPGAVAFTKQTPKKHMGAMDLAIVADPVTGAIEFMDKTPVWGFAMWNGIKKTAREALTF